MRMIFRVFVNGVKRFEETVEGPDNAVGDMLPQLAARHVAMLEEQPGWIEVECPDEIDPNARLFRIPSRMAIPIAFSVN